MSTLERAISIAATAHAGQIDKAGRPYILHPLRVMLALDAVDDQIAGVLHDVVEDTEVTLDRLRAEGFSDAVLAAVDSVTKRDDEDYPAFVLRAGANPIGRRVKLADLRDNSDLCRIAHPTDKDRERIVRYRAAIDALLALA